MKWNLDDGMPIWPQLKDIITREVIVGIYAPGSAFPTVRDLAQEAGVNRNTMQRAMSELEAEGILITNRTSGRVVTSDSKLILKKKKELAMDYVGEYVRKMEDIGFSREEAVEMITHQNTGGGENEC